ncbi:MAG: hypothetical protein AAF235_00775 [Planctomycetota bacterium]
MIAANDNDLRVIRYAKGYGFSAQQWRSALARMDDRVPFSDGGAEPLKHGAAGSVWRTRLTLGAASTARTINCVIKVERLGTFWKHAKAVAGATKAQKQWRGAEALARIKVKAAEPLAILRSNKHELLVLRHVEAPTALEHLRDVLGDPRAERSLARLIARHHAVLWRNRASNRDAKPSNLLVVPGDAGPSITVLDTVAIRPPKRSSKPPAAAQRTPARHDVRALLDLYFEPAGCGLPLRRTLLLRALRAFAEVPDHRGASVTDDREAWQTASRLIWDELAREIKRHGDPTPADNPLERPAVPLRP